MSVAWIGNQAVSLTVAIQQSATLLVSSRCPVFSIDSDVHGSRAAIALAQRLGAAYDHVKGNDLAREVALYSNHGGFFTTPGETRRRADCIVLVGEIPADHHELMLSLAAVSPDLAPPGGRTWFQLGDGQADGLAAKLGTVRVGEAEQPLSKLLGLARALLAGRKASMALTAAEEFRTALLRAQFPVFIFSGYRQDQASLQMLQGLIADINQSRRASSLFLPADDGAWGFALTSLWMSGFPPRTSFADVGPAYDPQLFDIGRMLDEGEADLHLWISEDETRPPQGSQQPVLIAFSYSPRPVGGAAVTVRIGKAGADHAGVGYSSRTGSFAARDATAPSDLPPVSAILRQLAQALPPGEELPC